MTNTDIDWADIVWNPLRGCSRISEGCRNCYAEKIAGRFSGEAQPFHGFATMTPSGARWTGNVELLPDKLTEPVERRKWAKRFFAQNARKPRCFVNSMSDLFHEAVPLVSVQNLFTVMASVPEIDFLVLTKRGERMRDISDSLYPDSDDFPENVWLGVSVEDEKNEIGRISPLVHSVAATRFISYEPALGPMRPRFAGIDWIICGDDSGSGARPADWDWYRNLLAARIERKAKTKIFIKQLCLNGKRIPFEQWPSDLQVREFPNA